MIIGVTGGVGAGKSTVLDYLHEKYGAAIILADDVAKELMLPGRASYQAVVDYFGPKILTGGQGTEIDRGKLAEIVFADAQKLKALNERTHPLVEKRIREMIAQFVSAGVSMVVIEAALFIQAGYEKIVDELWVVYADYKVRVQRLMDSRGYSQEKIDSIIANQLSDEEMLSHADFVIHNSGTAQDTRQQIDAYVTGMNNYDA